MNFFTCFVCVSFGRGEVLCEIGVKCTEVMRITWAPFRATNSFIKTEEWVEKRERVSERTTSREEQ